MDRLSESAATLAFAPGGQAYHWRADILWVSAISDGLIALAFVSIPLTLLWFLRERRGQRFRWVIYLFAAFILTCGVTHVVEIWTLWHPHYELQAFAKACTAFVSMVAAILLWPLVPRAAKLPSFDQMDARLKQSEERYRSLAAATLSVVWTADSEGCFVEEQPSWQAFTGQAWRVHAGLGWREAIHADDRALVQPLWAEVASTQQMQMIVVRLWRAAGEQYRYVELRVVPIKRADGIVREWIGTCADVHEQYLQRIALERSEHEFRFLADFMPQMIWKTGPDGKPEYLNKRWYEFAGPKLGSVPNASWTPMLYPSELEAARAWWKRCLERGEPYEYKYRLLRDSDQTYRWLLVRGNPMRDESGKIINWLGTCTDIDDEMRASELLERRVSERTAELAATNRELEAFSYSVSHDLRAPLRGIDGFADVMIRQYSDVIDERGRGYLHRIKNAAARMALLIDDIINLSQLTRKVMHVDEVDLSAMAKEIVETLKTRDATREVKVEIAEGLRVRGDEMLMHAVLENLLGNAWKFTRKREGAHISFGMGDGAGAGREVGVGVGPDARRVFCVRDNGAGFDMKYAGKLFGAFQRLHLQTEFEGTGIGLASVQRVIQRHQGRVWAEAEEGKGASFFFSVGEVAAGALLDRSGGA